MSNWFDILAFIATAAVFGGAIYVVRLVSTQVTNSINATKESLKSRGVNVSATGVSVRTNSRYTHEDYVDATQRGFVRAMGASSFGTASADDDSLDPAAIVPPSSGVGRSASSSGLPPPGSAGSGKSGAGSTGSGSGGVGGSGGGAKNRAPPLSRTTSGASVLTNGSGSGVSVGNKAEGVEGGETKRRRFGLRRTASSK